MRARNPNQISLHYTIAARISSLHFVWVFTRQRGGLGGGTYPYHLPMWVSNFICGHRKAFWGKSILQVPDTGTRVLDNTRPFLCSSIVSFWITLACSKERKDHIFEQYWYTKNVPVLTNTGTFQYLGPEVYFFPFWFWGQPVQLNCGAFGGRTHGWNIWLIWNTSADFIVFEVAVKLVQPFWYFVRWMNCVNNGRQN